MKKHKLTKEEKEIENALLRGEYIPIKGKELENIEKALKLRKKDITMTIRVNSEDIDKIKNKAKKLGVKYQTYISEVIHQVAEA
jgi:predicted DNA binding CopG/RHH family protein